MFVHTHVAACTVVYMDETSLHNHRREKSEEQRAIVHLD